MNPYAASVAYLMQRLPMFSQVGSDAIKNGLDNIIRLCALLDNPQDRFKSIHIAGTNGKGSTSHMMAAVLQKSGYTTGLYTSPHLVDLRERIRINGVPVSEDFVVDFVEKMRPAVEEIDPSYFELNVAMAFAAFAEYEVDVAVIETGLGGRLDSTNILHPELSVITNIGLDHTHILGHTLAEIAMEKAGIIKEGVPVVIGETQPETEQLFFLEALKKQCPVSFADSIWDMVRVKQDDRSQTYKAIHKGEQKIYTFSTDLLGTYQARNLKTVLTAFGILQQQGWQVSREQIWEGLLSVKAATGLQGRWDWIQQKPNIILDVAHNPAGMAFLAENLQSLRDSGGLGAKATLHVVCGFVKDKDVSASLAFFPEQAVYYFTQADMPRALPAAELAAFAAAQGIEGTPYPTVPSAVQSALTQLKPEDTLLITGSFFIVGEAMVYLEERKGMEV